MVDSPVPMSTIESVLTLNGVASPKRGRIARHPDVRDQRRPEDIRHRDEADGGFVLSGHHRRGAIEGRARCCR